MKLIFYIAVCILMLVESSIYSLYPYYFISISFMGYISYKFEEEALYYNMLIAFFISLYSSTIPYDIMFFILFTILLKRMFKYILFHKFNIFIITLVEVLLYNIYILIFKKYEFVFIFWIKQYIFIFIYNYLFVTFEKKFSR